MYILLQMENVITQNEEGIDLFEFGSLDLQDCDNTESRKRETCEGNASNTHGVHMKGVKRGP